MYIKKDQLYNKVNSNFFLSVSKVCDSLIRLGGTCPGGMCPGGKCPGGKCPGGICPWGKCPGGTCPGGLCPRTSIKVYTCYTINTWLSCCF